MTEIKIRLRQLEQRQQRRAGVAVIAPDGAGFVLQIGDSKRQFSSMEEAERAYFEKYESSPVIIIDL